MDAATLSPTSDRGTVGRARTILKPPGGRRFGVVVGIDRYRDQRLNLRHAGADAQALYDLMVDPECGSFAPEDVRLLRSEEATKEAIWRALAEVRRKSGPDDDVWIFYAGHAAPEGDAVYWVAHDSDVDDLYGTGVSQLQISDVLAKIQARRVLTLLDCCHAAATAVQKNRSRDVMGERALLHAFEGEGRVTLAASNGSQKSVELGEFGHGAFTHFLVEGMRGEGDLDRDGVVTADELWVYLNGKVREAARKAGNTQTPVRTGEATHQFAISLNPRLSAVRRRHKGHIDGLVGRGPDRLSTDEAEFLVTIVEQGGTDEQRALLEDLEEVVAGRLPVPRFRRLVAAARPGAAARAEAERLATEEAQKAAEHARRTEVARAAEVRAQAERVAAERRAAAAETQRRLEEKAAAEAARKAEQARRVAPADDQVVAGSTGGVPPSSRVTPDEVPSGKGRAPTVEAAQSGPVERGASRRWRAWHWGLPLLGLLGFSVLGVGVAGAVGVVRWQEKAASEASQGTDTRQSAVPGSAWTSPTLGTMQWIPGGTFQMGSPAGAGAEDEGPQRLVTLTSGFWLMEHEVTQGEWKAVMGTNPSAFSSCGSTCPVEQVSWDDAMEFARRAGARDGTTYRLPTEAEWEFAARGGQSYTYAGSNEPGSVAWTSDNAAKTTHPVCQTARNGYRLCDMSGNVWEWVADWYGDYRSGPVVNPTGAASGTYRVDRGGGWRSLPEYARVAARGRDTPSNRSTILGFRLAKSVS